MLLRLSGRRAFTLVEMLVVISIIAVLAALLLPAVNMAREAGRRTSCGNNLRNLALAAQNCDSARGNYPASRTFWNDPKYQSAQVPLIGTSGDSAIAATLTWVHELMPYIERQDMRAAVEASLMAGGTVFHGAAGKLNLVFCPSDELDDNTSFNTTKIGTPMPYSQLSYGCNAGVMDNIAAIAPNVTGLDWQQNGVFANQLKGGVEQHANHCDWKSMPGIKLYKTSLGDITNGDGASNTILFAENSDLEEWNFAPTEANVGVFWDDCGISAGRPCQLLNKYPAYPAGPPNTKPVSLDPNQTPFQYLSCSNGMATPASYQTDIVPYARPLSQHPTGFMLAFCDGRVKFVSETIAYPVYARLMTSNGKKYLAAGWVKNPPYAQNVLPSQIPALADGDY